jgi:hypothetical protein
MPISGLTAGPSDVALETPALLGYAGKLTAYCNKHYRHSETCEPTRLAVSTASRFEGTL